MKLLVNDKEIAKYLAGLLDVKNYTKDILIPETHISEALGYALEERAKGVGKWQKKKHKIKDKIKTGVSKDLYAYVDAIKLRIKETRLEKYQTIHKNLSFFLRKFGHEFILKKYKASKNSDGFIKSTGLHIDPSATLVRRYDFNDIHQDCLLRNTVGNEKFLIDKIDNNLPFWFIDSGYTNFIESNKKWHRLVRNHLHAGKFFDAPVDRLHIFDKFPRQWRTGGDKILVIEPGQFAASIFHINIEDWKKSVEQELRQYTDKKIVFREKAPKKKRAPLYKHLLDEDYNCVVSINSNAATEAIWAGIPVITLDRHITNPVSKNSLADINNLYRGPLASWLAMLSYSQFTYEELVDGTAVEIVKKYHV